MWHWLVDVQRCCLSTPSCKWRFINGLHCVQVFPLQDWSIFNPLFSIVLCLWRFWLCKHHECLKWRQYILKWSLGTFGSYLHIRERWTKLAFCTWGNTPSRNDRAPWITTAWSLKETAIQTMTLRWERRLTLCNASDTLYWHPDSLT